MLTVMAGAGRGKAILASRSEPAKVYKVIALSTVRGPKAPVSVQRIGRGR